MDWQDRTEDQEKIAAIAEDAELSRRIVKWIDAVRQIDAIGHEYGEAWVHVTYWGSQSYAQIAPKLQIKPKENYN